MNANMNTNINIYININSNINKPLLRSCMPGAIAFPPATLWSQVAIWGFAKSFSFPQQIAPAVWSSQGKDPALFACLSPNAIHVLQRIRRTELEPVSATLHGGIVGSALG